jgi:hypothetical protein
MKKNIYNVEQENPSQLGLTWQTQNPRYETKIKKKKNFKSRTWQKNWSSIKKYKKNLI